MSRITTFQNEMENEAITTRKMLERVPADKFDWQPHPKSMTLRQLSAHVAELPGWAVYALNSDGLDFAETPYVPKKPDTNAELLSLFEKELEGCRSSLKMAKEEQLDENWTLRNGATVYSTGPKADVIRMAYNQIVHHRAQLGVYLRLLDIPIPGSYGPSADEQ